MTKNKIKNNNINVEKQLGVVFEDILDLTETKKMLKIFNDGYDDFIKRMGMSAVRIVERMTNGQILAEQKEFNCTVSLASGGFHGIIELPERPVLEINKITCGRNVIKDYTLVEKSGKFYVVIPFFSTFKKDKVSIQYTVGIHKNALNENLKTAISLVFKNLFEGKEFKSDNLTTLKLLLANEIFYNI